MFFKRVHFFQFFGLEVVIVEPIKRYFKFYERAQARKNRGLEKDEYDEIELEKAQKDVILWACCKLRSNIEQLGLVHAETKTPNLFELTQDKNVLDVVLKLAGIKL